MASYSFTANDLAQSDGSITGAITKYFQLTSGILTPLLTGIAGEINAIVTGQPLDAGQYGERFHWLDWSPIVLLDDEGCMLPVGTGDFTRTTGTLDNISWDGTNHTIVLLTSQPEIIVDDIIRVTGASIEGFNKDYTITTVSDSQNFITNSVSPTSAHSTGNWIRVATTGNERQYTDRFTTQQFTHWHYSNDWKYVDLQIEDFVEQTNFPLMLHLRTNPTTTDVVSGIGSPQAINTGYRAGLTNLGATAERYNQVNGDCLELALKQMLIETANVLSGHPQLSELMIDSEIRTALWDGSVTSGVAQQEADVTEVTLWAPTGAGRGNGSPYSVILDEDSDEYKSVVWHYKHLNRNPVMKAYKAIVSGIWPNLKVGGDAPQSDYEMDGLDWFQGWVFGTFGTPLEATHFAQQGNFRQRLVNNANSTYVQGGQAAERSRRAERDISAFASGSTPGTVDVITTTNYNPANESGTDVQVKNTTNYNGWFILQGFTNNTGTIIHSWDGDDATGTINPNFERVIPDTIRSTVDWLSFAYGVKGTTFWTANRILKRLCEDDSNMPPQFIGESLHEFELNGEGIWDKQLEIREEWTSIPNFDTLVLNWTASQPRVALWKSQTNFAYEHGRGDQTAGSPRAINRAWAHSNAFKNVGIATELIGEGIEWISDDDFSNGNIDNYDAIVAPAIYITTSGLTGIIQTYINDGNTFIVDKDSVISSGVTGLSIFSGIYHTDTNDTASLAPNFTPTSDLGFGTDAIVSGDHYVDFLYRVAETIKDLYPFTVDFALATGNGSRAIVKKRKHNNITYYVMVNANNRSSNTGESLWWDTYWTSSSVPGKFMDSGVAINVANTLNRTLIDVITLERFAPGVDIPISKSWGRVLQLQDFADNMIFESSNAIDSGVEATVNLLQ